MKLSYQVIELKLRDTFATAHSSSDVRRNIVIELRDDGDRVGRGEAAPYYGESLVGLTADLDRLKVVLKGPKVQREADLLAGLAGSVRSAFETATFDLLAQAQGVRLAELVGSDPAKPVATSFTLGQATPDVMARKAEAARGWDILKIKVGTPHDAENLAVIRRVHPQAVLRVDANGAWSEADAADRIAGLEAFGIEFVEQPIAPGDPDAYRRLKARCRLPIWLDESIKSADDVHRHAGGADGIVVKLAKCGGVGPVLECISAAREHGMKVMIGCMIESSLGITAAAHLAGLCDAADLDGHLLIANDPFFGVTVADGRLHLPAGAGLGVRPAGH